MPACPQTRLRLLPNRFFACVLAIGLCVGLAGPRARAADPVPELLKFMPPDVNTLSVIRVAEIMASPRAVQQQWKQKHETEFLAGSARIPPWVEVMVRATLLTSGQSGTTMSVSVAPEPKDISFDKLFPKSKFAPDTIAGQRALRSARGYMAEVAPGVLGYMAPLNRQAFSFWLRGRHDAPQLPKYLETAALKYKPQILYAVDLEDLLDPAAIGPRLLASRALQGKEDDRKAVESLLLHLKGLRLAIDVDDKIHGAVAFDFTEPVGPAGRYCQPILAELLDDAGAHLDEVDKAEVKIAASSVTLSSELSDASLRRLMTFVYTPVSVQTEEYAPAVAAKTAPVSEAAATQAYFTKVNHTILDLQVMNHTAKDYYKTAAWHQNYAKKISEFSTVGVDPEMVQYGKSIQRDLLGLAASLQGVPVQVNKLENKVTYNMNVNPWWPGGYWTVWGYTPAPWEVTSNVQQIRNAQDEAVEKGAQQREQIWNNMVSLRDSIQGQMTAKYNVKFSL
ncbi:MAG TPA: hypothetical protein VFE24_17355 [Pirellulales bacterium]|nr:hypothetical protein [Pirellulales bacterium]